MRGPLRNIRSNLTKLKEFGWIDRQTRAIFIEFSVYNPNINMLAVFELLIEFLPSGSLLTIPQIEPFMLFDTSTGFVYILNLSAKILFVIYAVFMAINQVKRILIVKLKYFSNFWNLIELSLIIVSTLGIIIHIIEINESELVLDFFRRTSGYGYYKLQNVSLINNSFRYCLGFCTALSILKLLKFLSFNKTIGFLSDTFKSSSEELIAFSLIFLILWFAFAQLKYLLFGSITLEYSTLLQSMTTSFLIALGAKFNIIDSILENSSFPLLGLLVFIFYNIFIVFMLLNIFVTIISNTFSCIRKDDKKRKNDFSLRYFINEQLKMLKEPQCEFLANRRSVDTKVYLDHVAFFPIKIDQFLHRVSQVCHETSFFSSLN